MSTMQEPAMRNDGNDNDKSTQSPKSDVKKLVVLQRGHQRAIKGQVVNFLTPMNNTVDQLPHPAEDTDIVYEQHPSESNGVQESATSATRTYCNY